MPKKKREFVGWAVFENERLAVWDERIPTFWLKGIAMDAAERSTFKTDVRKVRITIEPRSKS